MSPVEALRRWLDDNRASLEQQGCELDYREEAPAPGVERSGQIDLDHEDWLSRCFLLESGNGWVQYAHTSEDVVHEAAVSVSADQDVFDVMARLLEIVMSEGDTPPAVFR